MTLNNVSPSTLGGIFGLVLIAGTTFAKCVQSIANGGNNNSPRYNESGYRSRTFTNGQGGNFVPYASYPNNNYYSAPTTQYPYAGCTNDVVSYYGNGNYNNSGTNWGYDPMSRRHMSTEEYQRALINAYGTIPTPRQTTSYSYGYAYGDESPAPSLYSQWKDEPLVTKTSYNSTYTPNNTTYASIVSPQYLNQQPQTYDNAFTYPTQQPTPQYTPSYTTDAAGLNVVSGYDPTSRRNCVQPTATTTPVGNTVPTGFSQPVYQNPTTPPPTNTIDWNDQISSKISTDNSTTNFWSRHLVPIGQSQNPQYQSMFQYQQMQPMNQSAVNPYGMNGQYNYGYGYGADAYNNQPSPNFGYNTNNQFQTATNYNGYGYGYAYNDPVQYGYGNNQAYTGYQNTNNQLYNNQFAYSDGQGNRSYWPGQNQSVLSQIELERWMRENDDITRFVISDASKKSYRNDSYGKIPVPQVIIRQPVMQQPVQRPTQQASFPQVHEPPRQVPQEQYQNQNPNPNVVPTFERANNNNQQYQSSATNEQPQQLSACDRFFCDIPSTVIPEQNKVNASEQQKTKTEGSPSLANLKIPENGWFQFGNHNNNPITAPVSPSIMPGANSSNYDASEESHEEEKRFPTLAEVRAKLGAEQAAKVTIVTDENGKMISYRFHNADESKEAKEKVNEDENKSSSDKKTEEEVSVNGATPAFIFN